MDAGHPFGRRVVWSLPWIDLGEPRVLDANLLAKLSDLLVEPSLSLESRTRAFMLLAAQPLA